MDPSGTVLISITFVVDTFFLHSKLPCRHAALSDAPERCLSPSLSLSPSRRTTAPTALSRVMKDEPLPLRPPMTPIIAGPAPEYSPVAPMGFPVSLDIWAGLDDRAKSPPVVLPSEIRARAAAATTWLDTPVLATDSKDFVDVAFDPMFNCYYDPKHHVFYAPKPGLM